MKTETAPPLVAERVGGSSFDANINKDKRKAVASKVLWGLLFVVVAVGITIGIVYAIRNVALGPVVGPGAARVETAARVSEPPGAPGVTPQAADAIRDYARQQRKIADKNRTSFVAPTVLDKAAEMKPALPAPTPPAPQSIVMAQPVEFDIGPDDPRRKAMRAAIDATLRKGAEDGGWWRVEDKSLLVPVNAGQVAANGGEGRRLSENTSTAGTGALVAAPHQCYGVTQTGSNSDAPGAITIEILSGPLVGGKLYGKPTYNQETMSAVVDRLYFEGEEYKVEAQLVEAESMSPALEADVNHHYMQRILVPGVAAFLGGMGKAMGTAASTTTVGTVSTVQTGKLNTREQVAAGVGAAGDAAAKVLTHDAEQIKPTISLETNHAIIINFLHSVRTGDRAK